MKVISDTLLGVLCVEQVQRPTVATVSRSLSCPAGQVPPRLSVLRKVSAKLGGRIGWVRPARHNHPILPVPLSGTQFSQHDTFANCTQSFIYYNGLPQSINHEVLTSHGKLLCLFYHLV